LTARTATRYVSPAFRCSILKDASAWCEESIHVPPLSEYWYSVIGLPPFAEEFVTVINKAPFALEEARIDGALGAVKSAAEPSTNAWELFEESW
jgi:hypothetical protein